MVPYKFDAVMLYILTQRVLVLPRKLLGVSEQHQGQIVAIMKYRQCRIQSHTQPQSNG